MTTDDVVIREFQACDQEQVHALYSIAMNGYLHIPIAGQCYAWFVEDKLKPEGDMSNVQRIYMGDKAKGNFWVASFDGKIVGCVGAVPTSKYSPDHIELVRMFVSPECRKKSVGAKLVEALEVWAKCSGFEHIYLSTLGALEEPNFFYPKQGFVLAEAEDYDISDRRLDGVQFGTTIVVNHYVKNIM